MVKHSPQADALRNTPASWWGEPCRAQASYERWVTATAIALGEWQGPPGETGRTLWAAMGSFHSQPQRAGPEVRAAWLPGAKKGLLSLQRRIYFRIRSRELDLYLSVPDDVEDMKAGRVVVSSLSEQSSSVWYYEDGLIKNQVRAGMWQPPPRRGISGRAPGGVLPTPQRSSRAWNRLSEHLTSALSPKISCFPLPWRCEVISAIPEEFLSP